MIILPLSGSGQIHIKTENRPLARFLDCEWCYIDNFGNETELTKDYLYLFVERTLKQIDAMPSLDDIPELFGKIGQWQEFYYYPHDFNNAHAPEISRMQKALWLSTEEYGLFLYCFHNEVWAEIDRGYRPGLGDVKKYYHDPENYRVLLGRVNRDDIKEWKDILNEVQKYTCLKEKES